MARRGAKPKPLTVSAEDRASLEALIANPRAENRAVQRARIVLMAADGARNVEIAEAVGVKPGTVTKWRNRYREGGFHALSDAPRSGRPRTVTDDLVANVVELTLETAPKGATHWSTRGLAAKTGLSQSSISRIWQAFRLKPHRKETFELSTDSLFVDKLRDVVGLYVNPPERAVVFSVDEKTQIQALERTQTVLPMTSGHPKAFSPKYERHGTIDLFAALNCATGEVLASFEEEHKSAQVVAFFEKIDAAVDAELDIHIILDNASPHRSAETLRWVEAHPRFHLHYTPTYSSWLNLVEVIFSRLTERQLKHGVHTSVADLIEAIQEFIDAHNEDPKPFVWTKTADQILDKVARFCGGVLDRHGPNPRVPPPGSGEP